MAWDCYGLPTVPIMTKLVNFYIVPKDFSNGYQ